VNVPSWLTSPPALFVRAVVTRYSTAVGSLVAAGVAYYVFFALAPLAIGVGAVVGLFINASNVRQEWDALAQQHPEFLGALKPAVDALFELAERSSTGSVTVTTIVALGVAIYAASKAVYSMRVAASGIYGQTSRALGMVQRVISAVGALIFLAIIVGLIVAVTTLPTVLSELGLDISGLLTGLPWLDWVMLLVVIAGVVWVILVRAPVERVRVRWNSVALWGATAWVVGVTALLGVYTTWSSTVGAAIVVFGAPIALLIWLYLVLIGLIYAIAWNAEITERTSAGDQQSVQ